MWKSVEEGGKEGWGRVGSEIDTDTDTAVYGERNEM